MNLPSFPAARAVATRVQPHFSRHVPANADGTPDLSLQPDAATIENIVDAAFWASLRRQEGYVPKISLAFLPVSRAGQSISFERPLALAPEPLTRLSPAVERPGIHLGVWRENSELMVWGTTRALPEFCFVLEVVAPGLLVIKHSRGQESGKFINVAVLEGDQIKVIDHSATGPGCPAPLSAMLAFESPSSPAQSFSLLTQISVSMRAHGRGGLLLVVPANTEEWRASIVHPIQYAVSPPFCELTEMLKEEPGAKARRKWEDALRRAIDALAGLTAIDGATVITDQYELLAFGAKIGRRDDWPRIEQVIVTEPIEGATKEIMHPAQLGGTRHLSAAQFAQDQRDAIAVVASQDGRFTLFSWSSCEEMVHAHRVESLLL